MRDHKQLSNKTSAAMDKYLELYAEPETLLLSTFPGNLNLHTAVVIPAYQENSDFILRLLQTSFSCKNRLYIVVINQPHEDCNKNPQQQLADTIFRSGECVWQNGILVLLKLENDAGYLLMVDRFSFKPVAVKQGVGLARKIGCDLASALYQQQLLCNNWLGSTDADAILPADYFKVLSSLSHSEDNMRNLKSAAVFGFEHIDASRTNNSIDQGEQPQQITAAQQITRATHIYQCALRYYVKGLEWAGSSYAFYTLGSLLAINIHHYCQVRGFPRRAAGEDFYLLNKLAKVGVIGAIHSTRVQIISRLSDRVPFGTGPMVKKILSLKAGVSFKYYHPAVFHELKQLLRCFDKLWDEPSDLTVWSNQLTEITRAALTRARFFEVVRGLRQRCKTSVQFNRQLNEWFDAFKTLKYLHYLRDHRYGDIPLLQAILQWPPTSWPPTP